MEELIAESEKVRLLRKETQKWVFFRTAAVDTPGEKDIAPILEKLSSSADETDKSLCLILDGLGRPNSRALATLMNLLVTKAGNDRDIALVSPAQEWLDMLDILGVRERFITVDSADELIGEE